MSQPELLTKERLAKLFHVRPSTVERWAREKRIPVVKPSGKIIRFVLSDVLAALALRQREVLS